MDEACEAALSPFTGCAGSSAASTRVQASRTRRQPVRDATWEQRRAAERDRYPVPYRTVLWPTVSSSDSANAPLCWTPLSVSALGMER